MSKPRKRALLITKFFIIVTVLIILMIPSITKVDSFMGWMPVYLLSITDLLLFVLAVASWCNIDISKLLGVKNHRRKRRLVRDRLRLKIRKRCKLVRDRQFDQL